jgi:hypothetical protein
MIGRATVALLVAVALAGCAGGAAPSSSPPAPMRRLSDAEKAALAPILAAGLKDPAAAQFKWMPVVLRERDGVTDYCGMVNGKNSYGGYTGFSRFYAHLTKDTKGRFVGARLRSVEQPGEEYGFLGWLNGTCDQFGYTDFSQAQ